MLPSPKPETRRVGKMKFAIINNVKTEATKGAKGTCINCGSELIAKCGEIKDHHWAHKGIRNCDPWWENETEWHRFWKNQFPSLWQEVIHTDKTGEKHIADVKTDEGWVLEFQHSPIKSEEKYSRNTFYSKIVWIIDGRRLNRNIIQFQKLLNNSIRLKYGDITIYGIPNDSKLLREWSGLNVPVFFDFQESSNIQNSRLWLIIPAKSKNTVYVVPFSGANFIALHNQKGFNEMALEILPHITSFLNRNEMSRNSIHIISSSRQRGRL